MNMSDDFKYDRRLQERHLDKGLLTQDELDGRLKGLPDLAGEADALGVVLEHIERSADKRSSDRHLEVDPELID